MSWQVVLLLAVSGAVAGFVNSLAGGASVISMAVFMALGLPATAANATNRIAVLAQNVTSSAVFAREGFGFRRGLRLSVPAIAGNIAGSLAAVRISDETLKVCMGAVLVLVLAAMYFQGRRRKSGRGTEVRSLRWWHYAVFLAVGFYSGFIYIGVGYTVIAAAVLALGTDAVQANALKVYILMLSTPFSLAVFMAHGDIAYGYGLIHAAGNVAGAYVATRLAVRRGAGFVKVFMTAVIILMLADLTGLVSLSGAVEAVLGRR